jgi:dienelactone hydrolase
VAVLAAAVAACGHRRQPSPIRLASRDVQPVDPPAATVAPTNPPLQGDPPIGSLAVPGFSDAVVSIPIGATSPRPVVVATHGMWDFAEGLCDNWRWIMGNRAWVLCPRGHPMPDKTFRYRSAPALATEIDAALRALGERYPGYVDPGPILYTGFSLGANLGVWVITHDPARYPRAVLVEGGDEGFSASSAAAYAHAGGQRVLFACGLKFRVGSATRAARLLVRSGIDSRVVLGKLGKTGEFIHWYNGPVAEEIKGQLDWLLDGDPRFSEISQ